MPLPPAPLVTESEEDAARVASALRGDPGAHRALYERYRPLAWRVARGFGELDADDLEDVVQESFVRAFRRLATLKEPGRFGAWLLAITRNRALSRLARRRAGGELAEELLHQAEVAGSEVPSGPDTGAGAEVELVRRIIAELPEGPETETVHLFYVEGRLSAREIARRLGVGKSAITMRLERFRARVKGRVLAGMARLRGQRS